MVNNDSSSKSTKYFPSIYYALKRTGASLQAIKCFNLGRTHVGSEAFFDSSDPPGNGDTAAADSAAAAAAAAASMLSCLNVFPADIKRAATRKRSG